MSRDERWATTAVNCRTLVLFLELCQLSSPRPRTCLPWSSGCRYCNWSPASLPLTLAARSRALLLLPGFNQEGTLGLSLTSHTNLSALPLSNLSPICLPFPCYFCNPVRATAALTCPPITLFGFWGFFQDWQPLQGLLVLKPEASGDFCVFSSKQRGCYVFLILWGFPDCSRYETGDGQLITQTKPKDGRFWKKCTDTSRDWNGYFDAACLPGIHRFPILTELCYAFLYSS